MPELPDVEGFRRLVAANATGRRIDSVVVTDSGVLESGLDAERFARAVRGRRPGTALRHGKWLLLPLGDATSAHGVPCLLVHFGMTGGFVWCPGESDGHRHDRILLGFENGAELRYRDMRKLTGVRMAETDSDVDELLNALGPDAAEIPAGQFTARLRGTGSGIKAALLDQSVLAGLGNLCVDEALWRARTHPRRKARELSTAELGELHRGMGSVLRSSVREGHVPERAGWLNGSRNQRSRHCPRCSAVLRRAVIAGRTTVWCPACQSE
ncbi:Fpg/Nei family DNA glycosylase [Actinopolyspora halophila]|uniref:Fpg/Nei family DNA glycosylase n=1 Tax=Actinopolyspora halophila TaxID=1850 RepID=UPI000477385C|nr:DNA-formamidopyrimidine glycosylase family protein [Actinopolyspora halophila]